MTQRLIYNLSGQVLRHTPLTRQTAATWVLEDMRLSAGASGRTLDSGPVNVDSATEVTVSTIAGPTAANPRLIDVASTVGFVVGTRYEIVNADNGEREQFELSGIDTNDALYAKHPLVGTYPIGSTVQGVELVTAAIINAVVQDESRMQNDEPMRIVWSYGLTGTEHHQELVRLVRHDYGDVDLSRARQDIFDVFPDAATRFAYEGIDTIDPHLRLVYRQLRAKLLDRKIHAEEWLTGDQGHFALVWRTLWHFAQLGNAPSAGNSVDPREWTTYCKDQFEMYWGALTSGEGGREVAVVEPVSDVITSTQDTSYRRVFGEL